MKWVFVSLENIQPTLTSLGEQGVDTEDYTKFIEANGQAWIRFSGPRINNGVKAAAFEVRTGGSTIDHPKQLHYIPLHDLDDAISFINTTPHSLKLEEVTKPQEVEEVEVVIPEDDQLEIAQEFAEVNAEPVDYEDMMGDLEALMDMENEDL